jgi:deazaflavin-dependent oxidoreductase (nitroreductase family)
MSTQHGRGTAVSAAARGRVPAGQPGNAAPPRAAGNAIRLGPRTRRVIRAVARVVNPLVLRVAGRRHMPVLGVVHHRGRKSGRRYATPLGVRPTADGGFVVPLTFSDASQWYRNILAAGGCVITYLGADHALGRPTVVDRAAAGQAYPRYERLALRLIGINEFVWLSPVPAAAAARPAAMIGLSGMVPPGTMAAWSRRGEIRGLTSCLSRCASAR